MKKYAWPELGLDLHERFDRPAAGGPPRPADTAAERRAASGNLVHERALALMRETGSRDYAQALHFVLRADPALARAYLRGDAE